MNLELAKITDWISLNKLSLNMSKTKVIAIYFTNLDTSIFLPLKLLNKTIPNGLKVVILVLTIYSPSLNWNSLIYHISSKVNFILHQLSHFAYLTSKKTKLKLVKAMLTELCIVMLKKSILYNSVLSGLETKILNLIKK